MASEQEKRERRRQEQQRLINDQISRLRNDPQSRRSGLLRIFKGQYTDSRHQQGKPKIPDSAFQLYVLQFASRSKLFFKLRQ